LGFFIESSDLELENDERVQEGVYYLLKELAFIISSKELFKTDNVAVIYHRTWPVYEKFVNGDYDGQPKEGLGLAIINYACSHMYFLKQRRYNSRQYSFPLSEYPEESARVQGEILLAILNSLLYKLLAIRLYFGSKANSAI
jgi:hypothetical protein